jgi:hypothetical protein
MPWRITQDYRFEKKVLLKEPIEDGVLRFSIMKPTDESNIKKAS